MILRDRVGAPLQDLQETVCQLDLVLNICQVRKTTGVSRPGSIVLVWSQFSVAGSGITEIKHTEETAKKLEREARNA